MSSNPASKWSIQVVTAYTVSARPAQQLTPTPPVREIAGVITTLTTGSPQEQQDALNAHFLPNASFSHPFCRVPSFSKGAVPLARGVDSRWVLLCIYRWYRTLSPNIDITINSAGMLSVLQTRPERLPCPAASASSGP